MERTDIHKTITELFDGNYIYIVPLYQRNFAWGDQEITQLIQDLYENFITNTPYFVGSIIYIKRKSNDKLEVIDGQQRLTVLTLLLNVLGKDLLPQLYSSKLEYDSRKEVSHFLKQLYSSSSSEADTEEDSEVIKTFRAAYRALEDSPLSFDDESLTINNLKNSNRQTLNDFCIYISTNVFFVLAEMPQDTDVASYFEIMNNSGDQLRKHEIVKSLILASAKKLGLSISEMESLAMVWDACSQMDLRIQEALPPNKRVLLFGDNFESFLPENVTKLCDNVKTDGDYEVSSLDSIVSDEKYNVPSEVIADKDDNIENKGNAIIDFPNFLMHILRLCYNKYYQERSGADIPLNEKDLLTVYRAIETHIDPIQFIAQILYYRIIFDRYIVRIDGADSEEKWELAYLKKHKDNNGVYSKNTFGKETIDEKDKANEKVIKALSLLQVSYPQRKYKRFLNAILSWFKYGTVKYDYNWFMPKLNGLISSYIADIENEYGEKLYCLGTNTPRFVLNLVDYLYYLEDNGCIFDFKYYNSVEHHLPQSRENHNKIGRRILDSIGNLFLLSRRANSALNDGDPLAKADKSASVLDTLPPNRKYIYQQTRQNRRWEPDDIINHTNQIRDLLSRKEDLLKVKELEESPLLYPACLAISDYCQCNGTSKYGKKYNFKDLTNEDAKLAVDIVASWQNAHPDNNLEDYINEQLLSNSSLQDESWRRCFVKYPSIIDYCQDGNFTWNMHGLEIFLIPRNQIVSRSRELHCHLFYVKFGSENREIGIDKYGLWISLEDTPLKQSYPNARISLHLWISDDCRHWCYEIWTERSANAGENIALVKNGWSRNEEGNYYLPNRPFLCESPDDYEESVELAIKSYFEIMKVINQVK